MSTLPNSIIAITTIPVTDVVAEVAQSGLVGTEAEARTRTHFRVHVCEVLADASGLRLARPNGEKA